MNDLLQLADKVEALGKPCRKTDTLIAIAISPEDTNLPWSTLPGHVARLCGDQHWRDGHAPLYTVSIDAALTLVPEGFSRDVDATVPSAGITVRVHGPNGQDWWTQGDCTSEPCATVAAALRARAYALTPQEQK